MIPARFLGADNLEVGTAAVQLVVIQENDEFIRRGIHDLTVQVRQVILIVDLHVSDGTPWTMISLCPVAPPVFAEEGMVFRIDNGDLALRKWDLHRGNLLVSDLAR
jgi:hypothetical protein